MIYSSLYLLASPCVHVMLDPKKVLILLTFSEEVSSHKRECATIIIMHTPYRRPLAPYPLFSLSSCCDTTVYGHQQCQNCTDQDTQFEKHANYFVMAVGALRRLSFACQCMVPSNGIDARGNEAGRERTDRISSITVQGTGGTMPLGGGPAGPHICCWKLSSMFAPCDRQKHACLESINV
jgi:hypothetical protein